MKTVVIIVFALVAIMGLLLVMGSAELEWRNGESEDGQDQLCFRKDPDGERDGVPERQEPDQTRV